jgi:methyltransferase (TIGR00027 family)
LGDDVKWRRAMRSPRAIADLEAARRGAGASAVEADRVEKAAMEEGRPSATAVGAAVVRAMHQTLDDAPRILDDPIAARLVAPELERQQAIIRRFPFGARLRANFVMRSRYAEDCLAESMSQGVRQYVMLGAGLDTFAYRQPAWARALHIFEVDYPATQKWKLERLAAAGVAVPDNVSLVPVDFESVSVGEGLAAARFDSSVPSFFSSLGVSQYLSEDALDVSLKFVLTMPPSSEIAFSFVRAAKALSVGERVAGAMFAAIAAARGERWVTRFVQDRLERKLTAMGFAKVILFSADEANQRYFRGRHDGMRASRLEEIMRAIV